MHKVFTKEILSVHFFDFFWKNMECSTILSPLTLMLSIP